jgi:hypothetical protein
MMQQSSLDAPADGVAARNNKNDVFDDAVDTMKPLSACEMLERGYLLSIGGVLDEDELVWFPTKDENDTMDDTCEDDGEASKRSGGNSMGSLQDERTTGSHVSHHHFETLDYCRHHICDYTPSFRVAEDIAVKAPCNVFEECLQRLGEQDVRHNGNVRGNALSLQQQTTWSVQDAMDMIDLSNAPMDDQGISPVSDLVVLLTLTSFPFRIVHASESLLKSAEPPCLGTPFSDIITSSHPNSSKTTLQLTPSVPTQCSLQGGRRFEAKLVPVVSGRQDGGSTLVYHAIVLQEVARARSGAVRQDKDTNDTS